MHSNKPIKTAVFASTILILAVNPAHAARKSKVSLTIELPNSKIEVTEKGAIWIDGDQAGDITKDGEIWVAGEKEGGISDDEIWKAGEKVGEVTYDGDVWKEGSEIGNVTEDGTIWIDGSREGSFKGKNIKLVAAIVFFGFFELDR